MRRRGPVSKLFVRVGKAGGVRVRAAETLRGWEAAQGDVGREAEPAPIEP